MKYKRDKKLLLQVRVSDAELATLDAIAAEEKRTRSDVIRMFITSRGVSLNGNKQKEAI